jgi:hypothetical protein
MKSGNLNFLEPSGPLQACNGTALPLLISVKRLSQSQGHSAAGRIMSMKNSMIPSGIEPATFCLVAQRLNQLRHREPQPPWRLHGISFHSIVIFFNNCSCNIQCKWYWKTTANIQYAPFMAAPETFCTAPSWSGHQQVKKQNAMSNVACSVTSDATYKQAVVH